MKNLRIYTKTNGKYIIEVLDLKHPSVYGDIIRAIKFAENKPKIRGIYIDFRKIYSYSYPNCIVPIAGIMEYYNKIENLNLKLININNSYLKKTQFNKPKVITKTEIYKNKDSVFNRVWKFTNPSEAQTIAENLFSNVSQELNCEKGVINAMSWCVNEVMDNTLRHSKINEGYFMCQIHHHTKRLIFTLFDYGIGFFNSFIPSDYTPSNDKEALEMALSKNVTSDKKDGQGFGLWGLQSIIKSNNGYLNIASRSSAYIYENIKRKRDQFFDISYLSSQNGSVLVDFQLNYENAINLDDILEGGNYESFQQLIEDIEDENTSLKFLINEKSEGTGTRNAGLKTRTLLTNIFNETSNWIIIDFENVKYITSSYADECIAKLVEKIGEETFAKRFRLKHLNEDIQKIISFAINERLKVNQKT